MKKKRKDETETIILNVLGLICLIYCLIPYIAREAGEPPNPMAMIPMRKWEAAGFLLTIGFGPLAVVNVQAVNLLERRQVKLPWRALCLLPTIVCLCAVAQIWVPAIYSSITGIPEPAIQLQLQRTDTSEIQHWAFCTDGTMIVIDAPFEPDAAQLYTADQSCFSSELVEGKIVNTLVSTTVRDQDGAEVQADETISKILQTLAESIDYEIIEAKLMVVKSPHYDENDYYAAVQRSEDSRSICELYRVDYYIEWNIAHLWSWENVDVIGAK